MSSILGKPKRDGWQVINGVATVFTAIALTAGVLLGWFFLDTWRAQLDTDLNAHVQTIEGQVERLAEATERLSRTRLESADTIAQAQLQATLQETIRSYLHDVGSKDSSRIKPALHGLRRLIRDDTLIVTLALGTSQDSGYEALAEMGHEMMQRVMELAASRRGPLRSEARSALKRAGVDWSRRQTQRKMLANIAEGANGAGTSLDGLDLRGRAMTEVRCARCSFYLSRLDGADFTKADLSGANMAGALLGGVNLASARLQGADLSEALGWEEASFAGAALSADTLLPACFTAVWNLRPDGSVGNRKQGWEGALRNCRGPEVAELSPVTGAAADALAAQR